MLIINLPYVMRNFWHFVVSCLLCGLIYFVGLNGYYWLYLILYGLIWIIFFWRVEARKMKDIKQREWDRMLDVWLRSQQKND